MPLQLAVHVVIVQPPQVVREPLVLDCQQPKKAGLSRSRLSARSVLQNAYSILRSPLATRTPLETQEKRPSTELLVLGQCADPLAHGLDQRNDKRIHHGEIAQSFVHLRCAWHIRGTDGENRDRNNHSIDQVSCKIKKTTTKGLYSVL